MKYVTWFVGFIVVVIAVIVGSILIRNTLRSNTVTNTISNRVMIAEQLEGNTTVRLRIEGPVVANENHQSAQIDVSATGRSITYYKTYDKVVNKFSSYNNNQSALESFALALDRAGFTVENSAKAGVEYRGECATGNVYYMELLKDGKTEKSLWATTCGIPGSFGGNLSSVAELFREQIPDLPAVSSGIAFSF